jgi:hypothetical protein
MSLPSFADQEPTAAVASATTVVGESWCWKA